MTTSSNREAYITARATMADEKKFPRVFFRPAYSGGLCNLEKETWPYPVIFDIAGIDPNTIVPILRDHDQRKKIGQTSNITYNKEDIEADGELIYCGLEADADAVVEAVKRGAELQASIRTGLIAPENIEYVDAGQTVTVNNQTFNGPVEVVRRCGLREISIVTLGADANTGVIIEASLKGGNSNKEDEMAVNFKTFFNGLLRSGNVDKKTLARIAKCAEDAATEPPKPDEAAAEDEPPKPDEAAAEDETPKPEEAACEGEFLAFLASVGIDPATLTEPEMAVLQRVFEAMQSGAAEDEPPKPDEAAAEDEPPKSDEAAASWGGNTRYRKPATTGRRMASAAELNRRQQTGYPTFAGPNNADNPGICRVAEAALLMTGGHSGESLERVGFTRREIDAACSDGNTGLSIKSLAYRCGLLSATNFSDTSRIVQGINAGIMTNSLNPRYKVGQYRNAAAAGNLSNIDIPNILANVMYKSLLVGRQMVEDPTDKLSKVVNAQDFRTQNFYLMDLYGKFAATKDNGELENLKVSDSNYTNSVSMRGFEIKIPYEAIINDDTNALTDIPAAMGRKAAMAKQKIWWQTLINGLASINSVTGNPALSIDGLDKMFAKFKSIKDGDGDLLGIRGKYLIVPPSLINTARSIQHETVVIATGTNNKVLPASNPLAGTFDSVESEFLGANGGLNGWGDSGYMVIADPVELPVMIMGYLRNQKNPQMSTIKGDYEINGIKIGCWWGFGATIADTRAAVYSSGAGA